MRIVLRNLARQRIGRVEVIESQRPTRVHIEPAAREVMLDWEGAVDDAGHLRKCLACGGELFREKAFPQITLLVVVLAFAGALLGILGLVTTPTLIAMAVLLIIDIAILVLARQRLVCYRCRSTYSDTPMARYHRTWDRATAERYPPITATSATGENASLRFEDGAGLRR